MKSSTQSTINIKEVQSKVLEEYKETYIKTGRGITAIFALLRAEIEEMIAAKNPVKVQIKTLENILGIRIKKQTYYGWLKRNKLFTTGEVTNTTLSSEPPAPSKKKMEANAEQEEQKKKTEPDIRRTVS